MGLWEVMCALSNDLDGPLTLFWVTAFLRSNISKKVRFTDKVTTEH